MKKIFLLLFVTGLAKAQMPDFPMFMTEIPGQEQLRTEPFKYVQGFNEEVDKNVMWALEKYGNFTQPVKTLEKKKDANHFKANKNISVLSIDYYLNTGERGDYYATKFVVLNSIKKPVAGEDIYEVFNFNLDDMAKEKEKDIVIGADKNMHLIADKALAYTMLYCGLIKNYAIMEGGPRKALKALEQRKEDLKTKYSGNTVLIPAELLNNGISKEAFAGLKYKYEFESSDKIAERIKSGNGKGYSQLIFLKNDTWFDYVFLMDLETGDLHGYGSEGASTLSQTYKYPDDKRVKKVISNIGNCKY